MENTTLGVRDVFTMQIVGERELPTIYQVDAEGNVTLPYVHTVHVEGLEPHEVAALVRKLFIEKGILSDPSVIVRVEQYASKYFIVLGQVQKPGRFPFTAGLTLVQAISIAGGFGGTAKTDHVTLTRTTKTGQQTVTVSVDAITDGRSADIPLQVGDRIMVPQRVF